MNLCNYDHEIYGHIVIPSMGFDVHHLVDQSISIDHDIGGFKTQELDWQS